MHQIVLASTSPYRRALLEKLGLHFDVAQPQLDEEKAKRSLQFQKVTPLEMAQSLARLKAESLKSKKLIIIGGDQVVHCEGQIFGKPLAEKKAIEQLSFMNNKTHEIITAVCLTTPTENIEFYDIARLTMKNLTLAEIKSYVKTDLPLDCAGSYKIEKNGKNLFSTIEAQDLSAIEGLPLISLSQILQTLGYETKKIKNEST